MAYLCSDRTVKISRIPFLYLLLIEYVILLDVAQSRDPRFIVSKKRILRNL